MAEGEDRTEAASARRLERARAEGQVPMSREVPTLCVLAAATLVLAAAGAGTADRVRAALVPFLAEADRLEIGPALGRAAWVLASAAAPFAGAALLAGTAAVLLQSGFLVNLAALKPDLSRLDPRRGLRRVFGPDAAIEAVKSLVKLALVGWAGWIAATGLPPLLAAAIYWEPAQLMRGAAAQLLRLATGMLAAQVLVAGADVIHARIKHARSLRMSRQELREEHREAEGDPQIKGRIRQLRLQRARRRMLAAVPNAAVVVTNPTHFAVALAYERDRSAPRVVAKGVDAVAARIRAAAEAARVPLVANPPLARALYRVELDADIPPEQYQAVAEIIAYVWRLRARAVGRP